MTKDRIDQLLSGKRVKKKFSIQQDIEACRDPEESECLNPKPPKPATLSKSKSKDSFKLEEVFKNVNEIIELIEILTENIIQLQKKHVALQQSSRVDAVLKEKAEELNETIKKQANEAKAKISALDELSTGNEECAVDRIIKTQKSMLTRKLQHSKELYENSLQAHKQICEGIIKKQLHIVVKKVIRRVGCFPADKEVTEEELLAIIDSQDTAVFVDNYVRETSEAMLMLKDARDRHKEILAIERDILTIRDMFCDFAINVTQQAEMIDTIEYHIGNGILLAHKGNKRLKKAHKLRNSMRKKKVWLIICLTSVIAILLFSVILSFTNKD